MLAGVVRRQGALHVVAVGQIHAHHQRRPRHHAVVPAATERQLHARHLSSSLTLIAKQTVLSSYGLLLYVSLWL